MTDLRQDLAELLGVEQRATAYDPDARAYEAFGLYASGTRLLAPLAATTLNEALAETTGRWSWDRGDRLAIRELGPHRYPFERVGVDLLHIYAARRKSAPSYVYRDYATNREFGRWLEHICTIDLNVLAGLPIGLVGSEMDLHARRQTERPEGAVR